jgi:hypothetical protein
MSSTAPPPPKGGGNAIYVVVVVLLVAGIAGLLLWRSRAKSEPPIVIHAPDANAPIALNPHDEDEVPPPPEPAPDAGPEVKPTGKPSTGSACVAGMKCTGAVSGDLESALAFRAKQAHSCYDQALANDATLKGRVAISVRIAANGQVCSAGVASNDMGSPGVAQCVANKFRQSSYFPAPRGGCVDANVPITFVPGGR